MTSSEGQPEQTNQPTAPDAAQAAPAGGEGQQVEGYCVKCKAPRTMQAVEITKTKNGRNMAKGKCPVCGTTMTKFLKG